MEARFVRVELVVRLVFVVAGGVHVRHPGRQRLNLVLVVIPDRLVCHPARALVVGVGHVASVDDQI